jgi:hypothetical protein
VFSGAAVLRSIAHYRIGNDEWQPNPYREWYNERLDTIFTWKSDYQAQMRARRANSSDG